MKSNRFLLIVGLCVLVAITVYANHLLGQSEDQQVNAFQASTSFSDSSDVSDISDLSETSEIAAGNDYSQPEFDAGQFQNSVEQVQEDSFSAFKNDRNNVREKEIAYLDSIVTEPNTDDTTRKEAQNQKLDLVSAMEKEVTIEGLLNAKGFDKVVVTVHTGSVNVIVEAAMLDQTQVAQILDIVKSESGEPAENIKVIPKSG